MITHNQELVPIGDSSKLYRSTCVDRKVVGTLSANRCRSIAEKKSDISVFRGRESGVLLPTWSRCIFLGYTVLLCFLYSCRLSGVGLVCRVYRVDRVLSHVSCRRNWDSSTSLARRRVCPTPAPTLVPGEGAHSLAGEGGGVPMPTRGHTLWYSRYICTLWSGV
jgi:hypothetical protein